MNQWTYHDDVEHRLRSMQIPSWSDAPGGTATEVRHLKRFSWMDACKTHLSIHDHYTRFVVGDGIQWLSQVWTNHTKDTDGTAKQRHANRYTRTRWNWFAHSALRTFIPFFVCAGNPWRKTAIFVRSTMIDGRRWQSLITGIADDTHGSIGRADVFRPSNIC